MKKTNILILCTGNSCRSHMAEGLLKEMGSDLFEVFSAGSSPAGYVHPFAIEVMDEIGINISDHTSKHFDCYKDMSIETVITVCENAKSACPVFSGGINQYHWSFEDPPKARRVEESEIDAFRRIRDEIAKVFGAFLDGYRQALNSI